MATYQDLLDAIARVRAASADPGAWMQGLSGEDLALVSSPVTLSSPVVIDTLVSKIRAAHPAVFDAVAAQTGSAARAIATAEASLAQQNSVTAQIDLQVVTAILNAHSSNVAGQSALDDLQRDVEVAVIDCGDLDTPAGAREFQRYLTGRIRDIRAVVDSTGLDATSKATLAAALASLYRGAAPSGDEPQPESPTAEPDAPATVGPEARSAPPEGTAGSADPMLDELLGPGLEDFPSMSAQGVPLAGAPMSGSVPPIPPVPSIPSVPSIPAIPSIGSIPGLSGLSLPSGSEPLGATSGAEPFGATSGPGPFDDPPQRPDDIGPSGDTDRPGSTDTPGHPEPEQADPSAPGDATAVELPNGEVVMAPNPQLARVVEAAVGGTPVAEAFLQEGISIPPPGGAVSEPVDADQLRAGDIGVFVDRHALALGNGKALLNNQIQPVANVTGPGFLGWEHPPRPGAGSAPSESGSPAPTRPAVTLGPSR